MITVDKCKKCLEKFSSAFTLSDMELFIFPELLYAGLLANIMSPSIWKWRDDEWFRGIDSMNENRKIQRIKQYIINKYEFNLDLDTWGLTTKQEQIERFDSFLDIDLLKQSNALFGYEGDKYYFDIGIRQHFGLDKYNNDTIPYWKTESIEAMDAFIRKPGYKKRAGECVSLSLLYAAALFVVGRIPLEKIFLVGTPLHSQGFVLSGDGVITNNRRIVTKNMWFNGTELSTKARRALENEKITIIAHNTGYLHYFYDEATIDEEYYWLFKNAISSYLTADPVYGILPSFLRQAAEFMRHFSFIRRDGKEELFIKAEDAFDNEPEEGRSLSEQSRKKLLKSISKDRFSKNRIEGRIVVEDFERILRESNITFNEEGFKAIESFAVEYVGEGTASDFINRFKTFVALKPHINDAKEFSDFFHIKLKPEQSREEMIDYLERNIGSSNVINMAFYAYRDLNKINPGIFMHAAVNRNPVFFETVAGMSPDECFSFLRSLECVSIYEGSRTATPDEAVNFMCADGEEQALCMAAFLKKECEYSTVSVATSDAEIEVCSEYGVFRFPKSKPNACLNFSF